MANLLAPCRPLLLTLLLSLACLLSARPLLAAQTAPPPLPVELAAPSVPFLPYSQYLFDPSGSMDISEVATSRNALTWRALNLRELPRGNGALWLRFSLAPVPPGQRPGIFLLDMGQSLPGVPVLFEPVYNSLSASMEWRDSVPARRNILLLPEPGAETVTCYIRLDGLPGLWFAPMLRTPHDAATDFSSMAHWAALLALGVVMLLCILRGLSEHGQWRIWTACFVAAALGQGLCGMPATGSGQIGLSELPEILLPGMALMLLPHVGRHLMQTPLHSRMLDVQLVLLSLPGAVLALLPLIPGYGWLDRYLDLWPAATLLFVPTALWAWLTGLAGSKRFLLGCLLPPLFVAGGIVGLESDFPASVLAALPLWGVALSALLIAATRAPADREGAGSEEEEGGKGTSGGIHLTSPADRAARELDGDDVISLDQPLEGAGVHPMNDPALRLIPAAPVMPAAASAQTYLSPAFWEAALHEPLDNILRNGAALEGCSLPPAVRSHAEGMLSAARQLAEIIAAPDRVRDRARDGSSGCEPSGAFNLQYLMREVHDAVAPAAESAGIGLAWYMPPQLGHMYEGAAASLGATLRLLLESAVQATRQGAVHFSVRPRPESNAPGDLLFTITDSGAGLPPQGRSMLGLARAWEMAGRYGGSLGLEYGPKGATIAFTVRLRSLESPDEQTTDQADSLTDAAEAGTAAERAQAALPVVVLVAPEAAQRQEVAAMLADLPCRCAEAASLAEAPQEDFVPLLIIRGAEASPAAATWLRRFADRNAACSELPGRVLAITPDDSQWDKLADAGFTHALLEPIDAADLRQTVRDVLAAVAKAPDQNPEQDPKQDPNQDPGRSRQSAGRPPLPDLFGPAEDAPSPLQMPDLTALPDLMRFAEELRASGSRRPAAEEAPLTLDLATGDAAASPSPAPRLSEQEQTAFTSSAGLEGPLWLGEPEPVQAPAAESGTAGAVARPVLHDVAPDLPPHLAQEVEQIIASVDAASKEATASAGAAAELPDTPDSVLDTALAMPAALSAAAPDVPESAAPEVADLSNVMPPAMPEVPERAEKAASEVLPVEEEAAPANTADTAAVAGPVDAPMPEAGPAPRAEGGTDLADRLGATIVPVRAPQPGAARPAHPAEDLLEWVGEPMPIAAGQPREEAPVTAAEPLLSTAPVMQPTQPAARDRATLSAQASAPRNIASGYTSPSLRIPGEWVGEPTPIVRPAQAVRPEVQPKERPDGQPEGQPVAEPKTAAGSLAAQAAPVPEPASRPSADAAAAPAPAPASAGAGGSLMDFILGATPIRKEQPPLPSLIGEVPQGSPAPTGGMDTASVKAAAEPLLADPVEASPPLSAAVPHAVADSGPNMRPDIRPDIGPDTVPDAVLPPPVSHTADQPLRAAPQAVTAPPSPGPDKALMELIGRLDAAMDEAKFAFKARRAYLVGAAAGRIAADADAFGFRVLARMARCVESAAKANDMMALQDLLPELAVAVERNRIALSPCK